MTDPSVAESAKVHETPSTALAVPHAAQSQDQLITQHTSAVSAEPAKVRQLQHAFAQAVARPGGQALLLKTNNKADRWVPLATAVNSGRAFAVEVDSEILAVDADDAGLRAEMFRLRAECQRSGCMPVMVNSGQPGRLHLFARVGDRELHSRLAAAAKRRGMDVRQSIRPPLAPHRFARFSSTLLEPCDPLVALQALQRLVSPIIRLSERMENLLRYGDTQHIYKSRSEVVQALATAAVRAGWSFEMFLNTLLLAPLLGGAKLQEINDKRGYRAARKYATRSWQRAVRFVQAKADVRGDHNEAQRHARAVQSEADERAWPGMAGGSTRAVLEAHIAIAEQTARLDYHASIREVAELAGVSSPTARTAHRRLMKAGWLTLIQRGRGPYANRWRLRVPKQVRREGRAN